MTLQARNSRVLLVDLLAEGFGHLLADDLFWAEHLAPVVDAFHVYSSPESIARIRAVLPAVGTTALAPLRRRDAIRPQLIRRALGIRARGYPDVLFQSFEEISTLVFLARHPRTRVHLIVSNNLSFDRLERHPVVGPAVLRGVLRRAATVFVHSDFECGLVRDRYGVAESRIVIKPYHLLGLDRERPAWEGRERRIVFMGPVVNYKPLEPLLDLIRADEHGQFRYDLIGVADVSPAQRALLAGRPNVRMVPGPLPDEDYYRTIARASAVIMTHDRRFEGRLSGIWCDAIASGTPVVARAMAPHSEYFERFGAMGYLVDFDRPAWWIPLLDGSLEGRFPVFQQHAGACRAAAAPRPVVDVVAGAIARAAAADRGRVAD